MPADQAGHKLAVLWLSVVEEDESQLSEMRGVGALLLCDVFGLEFDH